MSLIAYFLLAWVRRNNFVNKNFSKLSKEIADPSSNSPESSCSKHAPASAQLTLSNWTMGRRQLDQKQLDQSQLVYKTSQPLAACLTTFHPNDSNPSSSNQIIINLSMKIGEVDSGSIRLPCLALSAQFQRAPSPLPPEGRRPAQ